MTSSDSSHRPPSGPKSQAKRAALTGRIADVMLAEGLAGIPLRDLAARLGTSDRMLLYYFEDKAELVQAAVAALAGRLDKVLETSRVSGRRPPAQVMRDTAAFLALPDLRPFRAVWADILARGGRGETPFAAIARAQIEGAIASLEEQLDLADAAERRRVAAAILAAIE
ncbi:TetR family transcriptional regulator, partial [Caulobacter sp.]|uniref:TetR family transcriptional regulator n=1 Tax=Caulobacter sp. TaxID=78 RepID=UPI002B48053F